MVQIFRKKRLFCITRKCTRMDRSSYAGPQSAKPDPTLFHEKRCLHSATCRNTSFLNTLDVMRLDCGGPPCRPGIRHSLLPCGQNGIRFTLNGSRLWLVRTKQFNWVVDCPRPLSYEDLAGDFAAAFREKSRLILFHSFGYFEASPGAGFA